MFNFVKSTAKLAAMIEQPHSEFIAFGGELHSEKTVNTNHTIE